MLKGEEELNTALLDGFEAFPPGWLDGYDEDDEDPFYYFYDDDDNLHELKLADMSGTGHELLKNYLIEVLRWLYRAEQWAVYGELNFYETTRPKETPLYPDVALLKGQTWRNMRSYRIGQDSPAPNLIIEIISEKTRRKDLDRKPIRFARWGTAEYFAYDPRLRQKRNPPQRLWGWRLSGPGEYEVLSSSAADGRLWSQELEAWLVPEESHLRLYSRDGQLLLTEAEAEQQVIEAERQAKEKAWAKLRELGIDPQDL